LVERNRLKTVGSRVRLRLATDDGLVALVRSGDTAAFETIYERHSAALLSFCAYMLSSRPDAEDAIQATFASAYRALQSNDRPMSLRPWLYAIARNESLSILRRRRPTVELNGEPALGGDPVRELEVREDLRNMVQGLRDLPERQRAALVLTEMHGLSQGEIGAVLGVRPDQVKAYVFQARSNLISDRNAREEDCREIREELATARGAALLRGRLRRHVRSCPDCRTYADGIARQRRQVAALLPVAPSLLLRSRVLGDLVGNGAADTATYTGGAVVGGSVADAALSLAGSGVKALAVKLATGVALVGLGAGVGASMLGVPIEAIGQGTSSTAAGQPEHRSLVAKVVRGGSLTVADTSTGPAPQDRPRRSGGSIEAGADGSRGVVSLSGPDQGAQDQSVGAGSSGVSDPGHEREGGSAGHGRKSEEERQRGQEEREQAGQERQHAREEREHNGQEHQRLHEEHEQTASESEREHEERKAKSGSKTKEERQHAREERESKGVSRPPHTKEERQHEREQHQREREEEP
jgi:RNA polymerase sigma factor (sigma-70 family)